MAGNHRSIDNNTRRFQSSNEELTQKISYSIYVTNFPDSVNSRDLWRECSVYGTVVDVYIPFKKSKAGKRFAFVRFIKVFNLDRLVKNLCTTWIGRYHLFANQVRFDRPHKTSSQKFYFPSLNDKTRDPGNVGKFPGQKAGFACSYVSAVNEAHPLAHPGFPISPSSALVLDNDCITERDFSKCAMGKRQQQEVVEGKFTRLGRKLPKISPDNMSFRLDICVISTPAHFDSKIISQTVRDLSSRVPTPLPDDPYVAVRQTHLVDTNTESGPLEDLRETGIPLPLLVTAEPKEAPLEIKESLTLVSRAPFTDEEFEASKPSDTRTTSSRSSASSDSTAPLSPDHPLTQSEDESPDPEKEEEAAPEGQHQAVPVVDTAADEPLGLGYEALRRRELALGHGLVPSTFEIGQSFRFLSEQQRVEETSAPRIPTPASPEWSSDSLPVSPSSLVVPSPIASPPTTLAATISVDKDQFLERYWLTSLEREQKMATVAFGALWRPVLALKAWGGHVDVRRIEMGHASYDDHRLRSLEREQKMAKVAFGALWRPVLALKAWGGHVDARRIEMGHARYDDHRLIHDLLVKNTMMQRELQELRDRVTTLEREGSRRGQ
nr:RNA-directed DNA polymerase, eukaryota, nucleotide-binding alpha-beta plait domain protein [Tanacetum cinerariifolium]